LKRNADGQENGYCCGDEGGLFHGSLSVSNLHSAKIKSSEVEFQKKSFSAQRFIEKFTSKITVKTPYLLQAVHFFVEETSLFA